MRQIGTAALMVTFSVAGIYAQQRSVNMTFSGNGGAAAINLQYSGTINNQDDFAGSSTLGSFTLRIISASDTTPAPQPPSSCSSSTQVYFVRKAGGGIFRFGDGSLMNVSMMQGADCIDFAAGQAHCTLTLQITGGTGRFSTATGTLTFTETSVPALADATGNPVFFAEWGQITGKVSGVALGGEGED